jgi:PAS domain S-box-containing protein
MRVRTKMFLITTGAMVCLIMVFLGISSIILVNSFADIEERNAEITTEKAVSWLENDIKMLASSTAVYAYWDETYFFAKGSNPQYPQSGIPDSTFINLGINAVVVVNGTGDVIYKMGYLASAGGETALPRGFNLHLGPSGSLMTNDYNGSMVSGIVLVDEALYEVCAMPILKNDQSGPEAGIFMMARLIDDKLVQRMRDDLQLTVSLSPLNHVTSVEGGIRSMGHSEVTLDVEGGDDIVGSTSFTDIYGHQVMQVQVPMPREVYNQALDSETTLLVVVVVLCILIILLTTFLLKYYVTNKLERLDREVRGIAERGNTRTRVHSNGPDEVGELGRSINGMLSALESTERLVMESERRYKAVVEDQTEVIFRTDSLWHITFSNAAFHLFFGGNLSDGRQFLPGTGLEEIGHLESRLSKLNVDAPSFDHEHQLLRQDGEQRWFQWRVRGVFDDSHRLSEVQWVGRDVTDRIKLLERLNQADKIEALGVLAGGIAHDFNNVLTSILGTLTLTRKGFEAQDPRHRRLEEAERSVLKATELTKQLLTFSRGGDPVKQPVDIRRFVQETSEFSVHGSNILLRTHFQDGIWSVLADQGQLFQVVSNLVINAKQAMPKGGHITISGENVEVRSGGEGPISPGRYVRLDFLDDGMGIEPEVMPKVFDPYFSTKKEGSGLGLTIVHSIVLRHKGHIELSSIPGEGTVFHVYLPAIDATALTQEEPGEFATFHGRLLLMDDDEAILEVGQALLEEKGFNVTCAQDGGRTLRLYQEAMETGVPFDLVIMDLTIRGGMGGKEAIARLRQMDPTALAIVSSGYSNDPVMASFKDHGFDGVVQKPYTIKEMLHTIQTLIEARERIRDERRVLAMEVMDQAVEDT